MIDFGLSKHFSIGEIQHEAVGTPYTVAPEVISGSYDERCDVWAIGVITFLLLSGESPFGGCGGPEPLMQVRQNILIGEFSFEPEEIWSNVSVQAIDFIRTLLVTDPNSRPTARECQKDAWLREWAQKNRNKEDNKLNPNVVRALVNFKEYSDMRKLLCEVLSFTLLPDQITDLRKEFEKLDTDGSGEISLAGLKKVLIQNAGAGSLGALTEEEVEDIFNAMRVRKTETRIHWHEFIAAGLSQCKVDERNLRLAFDRLDSDHKGYIAFENVMDLMGSDAAESEDAMRRMWGDSMKVCKSQNAHIGYDDFLLLMKGQTKDSESKTVYPPRKSATSLLLPSTQLDVLHEVTSCGDSHTTEDGLGLSRTLNSEEKESANNANETLATITSQLPLIPPTPSPINSPIRPFVDDEIDDDGPLMMEDDGPLMMEDDIDEQISDMADTKINMMQGIQFNPVSEPFIRLNTDLTPPQSPTRGAGDYITPISQRDKLSTGGGSCGGLSSVVVADFPPPLPSFSRLRSRSVDDNDHSGHDIDDDKDVPLFVPDVRRAMALPEHDHTKKDTNTLIKDETKTALVVNRHLYRAHRQMRLSVLEASKRFEEEQIKRTKERLKAQREAGKGHFGAGLVMRHGHSKELSSDSVRKFMKEKQKEQQPLVEKANKRGGRGRRTRKKTISDMSGMLACVNDEPCKTPVQKAPQIFPQFLVVTEPAAPDLRLSDTVQPTPTVPGEFRKTLDPFYQMKSLLDSNLEGDNISSVIEEHSDELVNTQHSIMISISDGKLHDQDESVCSATSSRLEDSPQVTLNDHRRINVSPTWPPPPPPL